MQCPKCEHDASQLEFGDPMRCPSCGVYYAKALAHKRRLQSEVVEDGGDEGLESPISDKIVKSVIGAQIAIQDVVKRGPSPTENNENGPQQVVVVDFKMGFLSMVWFMVKWALASIPAFIILVFICVGLFSFVSGLFSGFMR